MAEPEDDPHSTELDRALAESQREERDERDEDLAKQAEVDNRIAGLLSERDERD